MPEQPMSCGLLTPWCTEHTAVKMDNLQLQEHGWILETHCWVESSPGWLHIAWYTFLKAQKQTKVDNICLGMHT